MHNFCLSSSSDVPLQFWEVWNICFNPFISSKELLLGRHLFSQLFTLEKHSRVRDCVCSDWANSWEKKQVRLIRESRIVVNCIIRYRRITEESKAEVSCQDKKSFLRMGRCFLPHISSFWQRSDRDVLWKDTVLARNQKLLKIRIRKGKERGGRNNLPSAEGSYGHGGLKGKRLSLCISKWILRAHCWQRQCRGVIQTLGTLGGWTAGQCKLSKFLPMPCFSIRVISSASVR